jgi:hypothetical protein
MSEAVLIEHEGQFGVFIPLNGKVKVSLKLHQPHNPHQVIPDMRCDAYVTSQVILTSAAYTEVKEPTSVHGQTKSVSMPNLSLVSHGKWELECY